MSTPFGFLRSASVLSALTLVSRVLGLVREAVCASLFGLSIFWDNYTLAFCIPNLARRLFGEGALSAAFVPVLSQRVHHDDPEVARRLVGNVLTLLAVLLVALVVVGEIVLFTLGVFKPSILWILTAIMLPYMICICLVALMGGAQNTLGRFASPALMPILFNLIVIAVALGGEWAAPGAADRGVVVLAVAVVVAGIVQLLWQFAALRRSSLRPLWCCNLRDPDIRSIAAVMAPMILGLSAVQLNTLSDYVVARIMVEGPGGPSTLVYATRLYQLPVGLFGAALATAIFPSLSLLRAAGDDTGFRAMLERGLRLALFIGLPASAGLLAVREPLVQAIYEHKRFTAADTPRVAAATAAYGIAIWAYIAQQVVVRGFYAHGSARTPMRIATGMVGLNLGLNLFLVGRMGEAGIALATAVSAMTQFSILTWRATGSTSGTTCGRRSGPSPGVRSRGPFWCGWRPIRLARRWSWPAGGLSRPSQGPWWPVPGPMCSWRS